MIRKTNALEHFKDMLRSSDRDRVKDDMIGCTVMTVYNKKMYVIDDLDFTKKVSDTFHVSKTNEDISFVDYYRKQWNMQI